MDTPGRIKAARTGAGAIASTSFAAGKVVGAVRSRGGGARRELLGVRGDATVPKTRKLPVAAGVAAGAGGAYFLDPDRGRARRAVVRDKALKLARRGAGATGRRARSAGGRVVGAVQERRDSRRDPAQDLNDPALAARVESEIFRDEDAPKDKVVVNVENGVVYLRGEVGSTEQASALAESARDVDGVDRVESLLHLPGEEPESKDRQPKAAGQPGG